MLYVGCLIYTTPRFTKAETKTKTISDLLKAAQLVGGRVRTPERVLHMASKPWALSLGSIEPSGNIQCNITHKTKVLSRLGVLVCKMGRLNDERIYPM